jgi:hypothetical protein
LRVIIDIEVDDFLRTFHTDPEKGGHGERDHMQQAIGTYIALFF